MVKVRKPFIERNGALICTDCVDCFLVWCLVFPLNFSSGLLILVFLRVVLRLIRHRSSGLRWISFNRSNLFVCYLKSYFLLSRKRFAMWALFFYLLSFLISRYIWRFFFICGSFSAPVRTSARSFHLCNVCLAIF